MIFTNPVKNISVQTTKVTHQRKKIINVANIWPVRPFETVRD